LWLVFLLLGFTRLLPFLYFGAFVGIELAFEVFVRFNAVFPGSAPGGIIIVPLVLVAANLFIVAYATGEVLERGLL
jgi:hypothetical protein